MLTRVPGQTGAPGRVVHPQPGRYVFLLIWSFNSAFLKRYVETHWYVATRGKKHKSVVPGKIERTRVCEFK